MSILIDGIEKTICCAVVTYNRKECLRVMLDALKHQTISVDSIYLLDNCSTDGTQKMLIDMGFIQDERIEYDTPSYGGFEGIDTCYICNSENTGGAGGFAKIISVINQQNFDFVWIMDDDVRPEPDCLELLFGGIDSNHRACIPNRSDEYYQDKACIKLDMDRVFAIGLMNRKVFADITAENEYFEVEDMPFEGPLVDGRLMREVGIPEESYFLLCDDSDYAQRLLMHTKINFAKSAILHRQLAKASSQIGASGGTVMGWRDYYALRNEIIFIQKYARNNIAKRVSPIVGRIYWSLLSIYKRRWKNFKVINLAYKHAKDNKMGKTIPPKYNFDRKN